MFEIPGVTGSMNQIEGLWRKPRGPVSGQILGFGSVRIAGLVIGSLAFSSKSQICFGAKNT